MQADNHTLTATCRSVVTLPSNQLSWAWEAQEAIFPLPTCLLSSVFPGQKGGISMTVNGFFRLTIFQAAPQSFLHSPACNRRCTSIQFYQAVRTCAAASAKLPCIFKITVNVRFSWGICYLYSRARMPQPMRVAVCSSCKASRQRFSPYMTAVW